MSGVHKNHSMITIASQTWSLSRRNSNRDQGFYAVFSFFDLIYFTSLTSEGKSVSLL